MPRTFVRLKVAYRERLDMTGDEHFREAERLLGPRVVYSDPSGAASDEPPTTDMVLRAVGHALLAVAAAHWHVHDPSPSDEMFGGWS